MSKSTKNERILKWWADGLSVERIARKLGNPQNVQRVLDALATHNIYPEAYRINGDCP